MFTQYIFGLGLYCDLHPIRIGPSISTSEFGECCVFTKKEFFQAQEIKKMTIEA